MTYTEVTQILNGDEETCKKYADVKDMIFLFAELTNILKTMREKREATRRRRKEYKKQEEMKTKERNENEA